MTRPDFELLNQLEAFMTKTSKETVGLDDMTIREIMALTALRRAMTAEGRKSLLDGHAQATMIIVPAEEWIAPIAAAVELINGDLVLSTNDRSRRDEDQNERVAKALGKGDGVVGIATAPDRLPEIFKTVAQLKVVVPPADAALVSAVIRKICVGSVPVRFKACRPSMLSFNELCSFMRKGQKASAVCDRILAACAAKTDLQRDGENLPTLEEAIEYGEARTFALELKKDIEDLREGRIGWEDVDRGLVMHGEPGTGKTLFARMLGRELGIPTLVSSMADLFANSAGYLDSVVKAQRKIFDQARACAPCILFIDELDAIPNPETISSRGRDWWMPVINDFLSLLDGAGQQRDGVIVIGATNRLESIAPAILRPGRLERAIYVGPPSAAGVERILRHHLAGALADEDLSGVALTGEARRATGATIMEAVRAARRRARRADRPMVIDDLLAELPPPPAIAADDLRRIALHEAGHAVAAALLIPGDLMAASISEAALGMGGSVTLALTIGGFDTWETVRRRAVMLMAGMAAEEVFLGSHGTGAGGSARSDLAGGSTMLAIAVGSFGLGAEPRWLGPPEEMREMYRRDPWLRRTVDAALADMRLQAVDLVKAHRREVEAVAEALIERRRLDASEIFEIVTPPAPEIARSA